MSRAGGPGPGEAHARVFAIYQGGPDVPAGRRFAVREWFILPGARVTGGFLFFAWSLHGARLCVPKGAGYRLARERGDGEPDELVECWI